MSVEGSKAPVDGQFHNFRSNPNGRPGNGSPNVSWGFLLVTQVMPTPLRCELGTPHRSRRAVLQELAA